MIRQSTVGGERRYTVRVKDTDGRYLPVPRRGAATFTNKRDAEDYELSLKNEVRKAAQAGTTVKAMRAAEAEANAPEAALPFSDLVAEFREGYTSDRNADGGQSDHYTKELRNLEADLGDEDVRTWDVARLEDYRRTLETTPARRGKGRVKNGKPPSPTTVRKRLSVLSTVLTWAVGRRLIPYSPAVGLKKPKPSRHRVVWLSREDVGRLAEACPPMPDRAMVWVAATTGMRLKEVCLLRWADLDRGAMRIHVPPGKSGSRSIPMPQTTAAVLEDVPRMGTSPFVFHEDGQPLDTDARRKRVSNRVQAAAKAAKILDPDGKPVGFHVLRHTAASWMVQDGVSLYDVQAVLGHSSPTMTQRYAHLSPDYGREAAAAIDRRASREGLLRVNFEKAKVG